MVFRDAPCTPSADSPDAFVLTLWTNDPHRAAEADAAGIDRVGVDLESIGKEERQAGLGTWISPHREADLPALRAVLPRAHLFARTNPVHAGTAAEVERLLDLGVEVLMLPMFTTAQEVDVFARTVRGRATTVLLMESVVAARHVDEIVRVEGVDEVHIGLNDFSLTLGVPNRFAVMAHPIVAEVADAVRGRGLPFGIGGIGRAMDPSLPIPSDLIYAQYARLGATRALVARTFFPPSDPSFDLHAAVAAARSRLVEWFAASPEAVAAAHEDFCHRVAAAARW